jgi:hypothetical protein
LVKDDVPGPSNGVATSDFPSDHVGSERDEIHARLQNLEVDLTDALKTLGSRFDSVLTDMVCILSPHIVFFYLSIFCCEFFTCSAIVNYVLCNGHGFTVPNKTHKWIRFCLPYTPKCLPALYPLPSQKMCHHEKHAVKYFKL